jgi:DNA-binding CsgD family transcriptional regulator
MSGHVSRHAAMTAKEIAEAMGGITTSGVDKLLTSAFEKLRRNRRAQMLWERLGEERRSNNLGSLGRGEY